jgi:regulator of protease activity HflC (stomatin/prohibitin superfamily)
VEEKDQNKKLASAKRIAKKWLRAGAISSVILLPTVGVLNAWKKWVFQVRTNYGVVITQASGERIALDKPGWYSRTPFLSTREEEYPLANQVVFLHGEVDPHQVVTKDGIVIVAAASTFYSITDLRQYAIENVKEQKRPGTRDGDPMGTITPKEMLEKTLDSIVGGYIQQSNPKELIHNRSEAEKMIREALTETSIEKLYGITINGFYFTDTNYINSIVAANAERQVKITTADADKQARITAAEARVEVAKKEKEAIETLAGADAAQYQILEEALHPKTAEEKKQVREIYQSIVMYRTLKERSGDTVWIVPDGNVPTPTYNLKK